MLHSGSLKSTRVLPQLFDLENRKGEIVRDRRLPSSASLLWWVTAAVGLLLVACLTLAKKTHSGEHGLFTSTVTAWLAAESSALAPVAAALGSAVACIGQSKELAPSGRQILLTIAALAAISSSTAVSTTAAAVASTAVAA